MNLTRTAYGTWSGGRFMHYGEQLSEEHYMQLMRDSFAKGVRTFVTADVYGVGRADALLGEALKGIPREEYCLVGIVGHDIYEGIRQGSTRLPALHRSHAARAGEVLRLPQNGDGEEPGALPDLEVRPSHAPQPGQHQLHERKGVGRLHQNSRKQKV
jgi:hypothetical protein